MVFRVLRISVSVLLMAALDSVVVSGADIMVINPTKLNEKEIESQVSGEIVHVYHLAVF
jgi:hypothetical protein